MPRSNLEEKVGCIKAPCCIITSIIMLITTSIILLSVAGHFVFSGPTPKRSQHTDVGEKTADGSAKLLVGDSLLKSALTSAITVDDLERMGKALNEEEIGEVNPNCTVMYTAVQPNLVGREREATITRDMCKMERINKELKQARRRSKGGRKSGRKNRRKSGRGRKGQRPSSGRKNGGRGRGRRRRQRGQKKKGQMRQRKSLSTFLRPQQSRRQMRQRLHQESRHLKQEKAILRQQRRRFNGGHLGALALPRLKSFWADGEAYRDWKRKKGLQELLELPTAQLAIQQMWQGLIKQDDKWGEIYADMHNKTFAFDLEKPITEEDLTDVKPHEHFKHEMH